MRVEVDPSICQATGVCESIAPEIFSVNDEAMLEIADVELEDQAAELAERAVVNCPTQALSIRH